MDHFEDKSDYQEQILRDFHDRLCKECQAAESFTFDCEECSDWVEWEINNRIITDEYNNIERECKKEHQKWRSLVNQAPNSNFAKYDQVRCDKSAF